MVKAKSASDLINEIANLKVSHENPPSEISKDSHLETLTASLKALRETITPMERVELARHPQRPNIEMIQKTLLKDFIELHGDRQFGDDSAIYAGVGTFMGKGLMLIGHHKGIHPHDRVARNYGMPHPEGYRKALRMAQLAEKFSLPILFVIDTPGAHSDLESEQRGQGMAIAQNIYSLSAISTPMVALILGEGSSGGALAIGVADRVLMLENSIYSVISPESCASILWRCSSKRALAAENLHLDAPFLLKNGIIHEVIEEPDGAAHVDPKGAIDRIQESIRSHFHELSLLSLEDLMQQRYTFFRQMGEVDDCLI
ncbi:MAG: acetyl-CoA carboxylase carboxyltransferase subunit alpha [Chlamydiae bacterium]|nr:acetyl-CoA carboxylase carboxyltransferase subunit alpha [Chlamydiota bacterium]